MYKFCEGNSMPILNNPAVTAPHKANTEPTDKSMPAISTTNVMPTEIQMFTEIWRRTFQKLETVKNLSERNPIIRHKINKAING